MRKKEGMILLDIISVSIALIIISLALNRLEEGGKLEQNRITAEDRYQLQEMIDYHKTQGREILLNY